MVWIAGSSRAGYDYPGPFEATIIVEVDSPSQVRWLPAHTPMELPFVPLDPLVEGVVDVEVR